MRGRACAACAALLFLSACGAAPSTPLPASATPIQAASPTPLPAIQVASPASTSIPPTATLPPPPNAAAFPDASFYQWTMIVSGLRSPVDIQFPDDGSGRMFVVEQVGRIRIVQDGQLLEMPFLDITDRVVSAGNEQGLLGLAFDPDYRSNGYFYLNYTGSRGATFLSRFRVSTDANLAEANSEKVLLHIPQPFRNHNGGVLTFGPDGHLYAGLGDGGSAGDPLGNGQNTQVLLGKILRLDVHHGDPYAVPPDNPFGNEVWAYGLRNPWRISFDRLSGDLYIADVGQGEWEEIDYLPAGSPGGANFGWNYFEGAHRYAGALPPSAQFVAPVAEYHHNEGGCSVTGGYVYRGAMSEWSGIYLYGDFCSGKIWGLLRSANAWQTRLLFETQANITTFGQDPAGEVYFADRGGAIYRLERK